MDDAIRRDAGRSTAGPSTAGRGAGISDESNPDRGNPSVNGFLLGELSSSPPDIEFERTYEKRMRSFETRPEGPPSGYPRAKEIALLAIHERRVAGGAEDARGARAATPETRDRSREGGDSC